MFFSLYVSVMFSCWIFFIFWYVMQSQFSWKKSTLSTMIYDDGRWYDIKQNKKKKMVRMIIEWVRLQQLEWHFPWFWLLLLLLVRTTRPNVYCLSTLISNYSNRICIPYTMKKILFRFWIFFFGWVVVVCFCYCAFLFESCVTNILIVIDTK